jgi:hypothetical protein
MLNIKEAQFDALTGAQRTAFLMRIQDFIESNLGRRVEPQEAELLFQRGDEYGLVSEREFARYMFIAAASETASAPADPPWLSQIMGDRTRPARERLDRLFLEAEQQLVVFREPVR